MFSTTTMASSIRMPIESDNASIVMVLKVNPMARMNANVAMTLVGKATALIKVMRKSSSRRKMINTASTPPTTRSSCTEAMEFSMKVELSRATRKVAPARVT